MRRRLSASGGAALSEGHFAQHGGVPKHFDGHGIWKSSRARKLAARQISSHSYAGAAAAPHGEHSHSGLSSPCLGDALPQWLLLDATLAAIGAPAGSSFINLDNGHGFNYTSDQPFVGDIYTKALAKGLRALIYEGDNDACGLSTVPVEDVFVSHFRSIGLNKTQRWRPWTIDGKRTLGGCASYHHLARPCSNAAARGPSAPSTPRCLLNHDSTSPPPLCQTSLQNNYAIVAVCFDCSLLEG